MKDIVKHESKNIIEDNIEQLKILFPNIVKDGKINFKELQLILGEEIETDKESYKFEWSGKSDCYKVIQSQSYSTLKPQKEESINFEDSDNLIIEGDNLEVLKLLQSTYGSNGGKIKMIYIDPPYNTGNEYLYPDNFHTPLDNYFEQTGQTKNGESTQSKKSKDGRKHIQWLNMMYPRLMLSRTLLQEDGVIFISIDDNEYDNLKKLCNDTFGEENFLVKINRIQSKGKNNGIYFNIENDYILVYAKNKDKCVINKILKKTEEKKYTLKDSISKFKRRPFEMLGTDVNLSNRNLLGYTIYVHPKTKDIKVLHDYDLSNKEVYQEPNKELLKKGYTYFRPRKGNNGLGIWRWNKESLLKKVSEIDFDFNEQRVFLKDRYKKNIELLPTSNLEILNTLGTTEIQDIFGFKPFDYPKPTSLIKHLIKIGMNKNDTILDFFAGSGTTGQSVLELNKEDGGNRKFILVQLPEKTDNPEFPTISEITKERIRRVIRGYGDNPAPINSGFKVFKLDSSNYSINEKLSVNSKTDRKKLLQQLRQSLLKDDSLVDGYKELDVIYEVILKEGYSLNSKIKRLEILDMIIFKVIDGNKKIYITFNQIHSDIELDEEFKNISNDTLFVCLDKNLTDSDKSNLSKTFLLKTI